MQPKPGKRTGKAKNAAPSNLVKTKGTKPTPKPTPAAKPKVLTPKARVAKMRTDAEAALTEVFGKRIELDDEDVITNSVLAGVVFDRDEVRRQAVVLAGHVEGIKDSLTTNLLRLAEHEARVELAIAGLRSLLDTSRQVAQQVKGIKTLAGKVGSGIDPATDPLTRITWSILNTAIAAPGPDPTPGAHVVVDHRRQRINDIAADITGRLDNIIGILAILNGGPGASPHGRIPDSLVNAMNRGDPGNTKLLQALRSGLEQEPDPVKLRALLDDADSPVEVPKLMSEAKAVKAVLGDVLRVCRPIVPPG